jgi:hypothetical protein
MVKSKPTINEEINNIKGLTKDENGIPELTRENIKAVHNYVIKESSYSDSSGDNFVQNYFEGNKNIDLSTIITRIILIDTVDSTNLKRLLGKDYYKILAKDILEYKLEDKISKGENIGDLFEKIAHRKVKRSGKETDMNLFIFLSKYITRVNQYCYERNDYSILDNVVKDNISYYKKDAKIDSYRNKYDYDGYCDYRSKIINDIQGITRIELDHFIWFTFKKMSVGDKNFNNNNI